MQRLKMRTNHNLYRVGEKCWNRKTWRECVNDDMKLFGLQLEWAVFMDMWRGFISRLTSNPS